MLLESLGGPAPDTDLRLARQIGPAVARQVNRDAKSPNMKPRGEAGGIYLLGEAPSLTDDEKGDFWTGSAGALLLAGIRRLGLPVRMGWACPTRPAKGHRPTPFALEAYREPVERDIAAARPKVLVPIGQPATAWVSRTIGAAQNTHTAGRRYLTDLAGHVCWMVPLLDPVRVLQMREDRKLGEFFVQRWRNDFDVVAQAAKRTPGGVVKLDSLLTPDGKVLIDGSGPDDLARLKQALLKTKQDKLTACDIETAGDLRPYGDGQILSIAFYGTASGPLAIALDHPGAAWSKPQREQVGRWLRQLLLNRDKPLVFHNLAFDLEWLAHRLDRRLLYPRGGVSVWQDTQVGGFVLDHRRLHNLDFLARQYLGVEYKKEAGVDRKRLGEESLNRVLLYNAADTMATLFLHSRLQAELHDAGSLDAYREHMRRIPAVVHAQLEGMPVDVARQKKLEQEWTAVRDRADKELRALPEVRVYSRAKGPFNPNSDAQIARLFAMNNIAPPESFDKEHLGSLDNPIGRKLLTLRRAEKVLSTYILPMRLGSESSVVWPDGRLHTQLKTTKAVTARFSSADPNLQNWPKRDDGLKVVRRMIKAPPGYSIISIDFGQLEWRTVAWESGDQYMHKAIAEGVDVHGLWAARLAKAFPKRCNPNDPKALKKFRSEVKNLMVFPAIYLAAMRYIARLLGIDDRKFAPHFDYFWSEMAGVKAWQQQNLDSYRDRGYVRALSGMRFFANPEWGVLDKSKLVNYPPQHDGAVVCAESMATLCEQAYEYDMPHLAPVLQIHDDLTFICPDDRLGETVPYLARVMTERRFGWITTPLLVEVSVGKDWADMREVAKFDSGSDFDNFTLPQEALR